LTALTVSTSISSGVPVPIGSLGCDVVMVLNSAVRDKMFGHFVFVDDAADRERNLVLAAQRLFGAMNGWRVDAVDNKATARMSIPLYVAAAAGTL
jgi:hypothetical protein